MRSLASLQQRLDLDLHGRRAAGQGCFDHAAGSRRSHQEPRHGLGRPAGGRQANPAGIAVRLGREALERDCQVGPAFGGHKCVHLVHDDVLDPAPVIAPACLAEQERETLRRRDQDVRRLVSELAAEIGRGISRPHADTDGALAAPQQPLDCRQRDRQVALDVVAQTPERRDVNAAQSRCELALGVAPEQPVEDRQKPGQRLARPGRRDQQQMLARRDRGPGQPLRGSRSLGKGTGKPVSRRTRKRPQCVPCFNIDRVHPGSDGTSWPHRLPLSKSIILGLEDGPRAESEYANQRCKAWEQGDAVWTEQMSRK